MHFQDILVKQQSYRERKLLRSYPMVQLQVIFPSGTCKRKPLPSNLETENQNSFKFAKHNTKLKTLD